MADGSVQLAIQVAKAAGTGANITYILRDGARRTVQVPYGYSVMEGARRYGIPGIEGDCGGACACATCHVYLEEGWDERLPLTDELERGMLDYAFDVKANSRLSCQIKVDDAVQGLVVRIPERQY
ncbi:MAG TPA: 2Fe-2S iron-sulfur cluster-binding protein [Caulobacteraceae bacterium]|nr:2Fe-2S iron-sulfur cluster-binding protein [Caulobacteraceae bacterium]